jgi:hypothetical protein
LEDFFRTIGGAIATIEVLVVVEIWAMRYLRYHIERDTVTLPGAGAKRRRNGRIQKSGGVILVVVVVVTSRAVDLVYMEAAHRPIPVID